MFSLPKAQQFKSIEARLSDFKDSTDIQFSDLKTQLSDTRTQLRSQDTRLWGFVVTLSLAIIGFLSKLAFFPQS